ncbi:MAG: hypothetical protein KGI57_07440 [Hyphomicrobiales bacterium]|nr:hypothetical protein [Hyphomicrobiales bacterium]MDE2017521.1 hypothetical protein [Hyphomicrobiales bacterium]
MSDVARPSEDRRLVLWLSALAAAAILGGAGLLWVRYGGRMMVDGLAAAWSCL